MSRGHSTHNDEPAAAAEAEPAAAAAAEPAPASAGESAPQAEKPLTLEERVAKLESYIPRIQALIGGP